MKTSSFRVWYSMVLFCGWFTDKIGCSSIAIRMDTKQHISRDLGHKLRSLPSLTVKKSTEVLNL